MFGYIVDSWKGVGRGVFGQEECLVWIGKRTQRGTGLVSDQGIGEIENADFFPPEEQFKIAVFVSGSQGELKAAKSLANVVEFTFKFDLAFFAH